MGRAFGSGVAGCGTSRHRQARPGETITVRDPTRDQVMDGAARCEGIPDNRVWLDCFYGSAQPMRAQLGLSPAPESQTRLVPAQGASYGGAVSGGAPVARRPTAKPKHEGSLAGLIGNTSPLAKCR